MAPDPSWLSLKLAHSLYRKSPDALDDSERKRVAKVAARQREIERRILAAPDATRVVLPAASVEVCLKDIRNRYPDDAGFEADLARAGLSPESLREAVERDLIVEAVLEGVAAGAEPASDTEVEIFYLQHQARFRRPEMRTLRHILVTINEAVPGSSRDAARAKIESIRARLTNDPARFAEQALRHSECPTAMNGGLIGKVPRGKLFAEIEGPAFALQPGEISAVAESSLGFHLLLCDAVHPEEQLPLAEVRENIRRHMTEKRREAAQKAWVAALFSA